jgi:hypothetical protein
MAFCLTFIFALILIKRTQETICVECIFNAELHYFDRFPHVIYAVGRRSLMKKVAAFLVYPPVLAFYRQWVVQRND